MNFNCNEETQLIKHSKSFVIWFCVISMAVDAIDRQYLVGKTAIR